MTCARWSRCTGRDARRKPVQGQAHALPLDGLRKPGGAFYIGRIQGRLAVMAAIMHLDSSHGELKSMRTAPEWQGKGVAEAMLRRLLDGARAAVRTSVWKRNGQGRLRPPWGFTQNTASKCARLSQTILSTNSASA